MVVAAHHEAPPAAVAVRGVVVRPDGKIVTVYYFNDHKDQERYIAATIWDPGLKP
jgi:hypothetical protein